MNWSRTAPLAGKTALITGGTQGLGEATARLFAALGAAKLVLVGRNEALGREIAASVASDALATHFIRADLAAQADCERVAAAMAELCPEIEILVNAAGVSHRGTLLDTGFAMFDELFAVNVRAPFFLMQAAAGLMRSRGGGGTIVNIVSMASHGGPPNLCAYSSSKAALAVLTKNAAFSLLPDRIRVNGLNIGQTSTPGEHAVQTGYHGQPANWLEEAAASKPFGRLLSPQDVAEAVVFLASDQSALMTGSIIDFDQTVAGCRVSSPPPPRL